MRRFAAIAAALLATAPGMAQAADNQCLTPAEFTSLATYALPSVITGTAQRCSTALAPDAYLRRNGERLAASYSAHKASAWPGAKAAFLKISSSSSADTNALIRGMPDASLQQMLDAAMAGMVGQRLPVERCATVDTVVRLLAPLPPQNTAELIALAVGLGSKTGDRKLGAINLCRA